ncbi:MAG: DUF423 domain-containing protein [Bacteroidota bacterium]|nr:DUF423 domain-containing protein [Bacteroidota bacterium]
MLKKLPLIGILGAIGVSLGALGAHFIKNKITPDLFHGYETAVSYHIYHLLAMLAVVILNQTYQHKYLKWAFNFFLWGIVCFSGSLYILCTRNLFGAEWLRFLGPITPIGGILFIVGWLFLAFSFVKKS